MTDPWESLTTDQWRDLISGVLLQHAEYVYLFTRDDLPHDALIRLYRRLSTPEARDHLRAAVGEMLSTTPLLLTDVERLYYLLQLVAFFTPPNCKSSLRTLLFSGLLRNYTVGGWNLHALALAASGQYGADAALEDYIFAHSAGADAVRIRLIGLRILSTSPEPEKAFRFLELVILRDLTHETAPLVAATLRGILETVGYRVFFDWYHRREASIASQYLEQFMEFSESFRTSVLPWSSIHLQNADGAELLTAAYFEAGQHVFGMNEVKIIARSGRRNGPDAVVHVLRRIWTETEREFGTAPWGVSHAPVGLAPAVIISNGKDRAVLKRETDEDAAILIEQVTPDTLTASVLQSHPGSLLSHFIYSQQVN